MFYNFMWFSLKKADKVFAREFPVDAEQGATDVEQLSASPFPVPGAPLVLKDNRVRYA